MTSELYTGDLDYKNAIMVVTLIEERGMLSLYNCSNQVKVTAIFVHGNQLNGQYYCGVTQMPPCLKSCASGGGRRKVTLSWRGWRNSNSNIFETTGGVWPEVTEGMEVADVPLSLSLHSGDKEGQCSHCVITPPCEYEIHVVSHKLLRTHLEYYKKQEDVV